MKKTYNIIVSTNLKFFMAIVLSLYIVYNYYSIFFDINLGSYFNLSLYVSYVLTFIISVGSVSLSMHRGSIKTSYPVLIYVGLSIIMIVSSFINDNLTPTVLVSSTFGVIVFTSNVVVVPTRESSYWTKKIFTLIFIFMSITYIILTLFYNEITRTSEGINSVYYPLLLFPLIISSNKKLVKFLLWALIIIVTLVSLKRTAILALFLMIFASMSVEYYLKNKKVSLKPILLSIVLILLIIYVSNLFNFNFFERFNNITNDEGSGRIDIYSKVIFALQQNSFIEWLIGHGFEGVTIHSGIGTSAHNDFLEVLYDFGLIGFSLYLLLIGTLAHKVIIQIRNRDWITINLVMSLVLFFVISIFSNLISIPTYFLITCYLWGIHFNGRSTIYENCLAL